ncbi:MAG: glycosyltransferase [Minisyncoccia bacterium]
MKVSFVIPAHNEEVKIAECLRSIAQEIDPVEHATEIIVVNNASEDRTKEIALTFPNVVVVDESRKGIVWARKAGFEVSTGDIIANVDADSILPKGWLSKVLHEFNSDEELLGLSGPLIYYDLPVHMRLFTKSWYVFGLAFDNLNHFLFKRGAMFQGGNYVVKKKAIEDIGGFDTSIEFYGEDIDIGKRLRQIGKVKWTLSLPMHSSGRRLREKGVIKMAFIYGINYLSTAFLGKPATDEYDDIRPDPSL